ncbi:MAG: RNA 2',3'-cyclic phosphodiesterase [Chloroflexi bacterium]|nr:RNA 2',3'-cyclic phosphodiesterase [Chloroflexota bacterium]
MHPSDPAPTSTWRLFVAVKLSPAALASLSTVAATLRQGMGGASRGVSWANLEHLHVTLKFLGEVSREATPLIQAQIAAATRDLPAFRLVLQGAGCFPSLANPRVVWVGLGGDPGLRALQTLQQVTEYALVALGFAPEQRPFQPHITLGRVNQLRAPEKRALGEAIKKVSVPATPPISIAVVYLMRSELKPGGALYTVVAQFPLEGGYREIHQSV